MTTNIDDVAQTLAEYERLAITSGAKVKIDPPEFSEGLSISTWEPFWIGAGNPRVARATVWRDEVPTTVYVVWDESVPAETAIADDGRPWRTIWAEQPTKRFGSFALRAALRRAFREVIGDRTEPDETEPRVLKPAVRDWAAEYRSATNVAQLDNIRRECKSERANTLQLEELWDARRSEIIAAEWTPVAPDEAPELSPDELARHIAFFGPQRPEPQDHQAPQNRAARRAAARKRGNR